MNGPITISVTDNATPALAAKVARMDPKRLAPIIGPRLNELTRDHLASNGTNKKGWPSTGFWEDAARATSWDFIPDGPYGAGIMIAVAKIGVRQRFYGGPIVPRNARALAIPINSEAYGKTPADFDNLILIKTPKGAYLAQGSFENIRYVGGSPRLAPRARVNVIKRQTLTFMFKLSMGVNQDADPDVIPSKDEYATVVIKSLTDAVAKIVRNN